MAVPTDTATETAKTAYNIFRGMKSPMSDPHWDELTLGEKMLLEWIVQWVRIQDQKKDDAS